VSKTGKQLFETLKDTAVSAISLAGSRLRDLPSEGFDGAVQMIKHGGAEGGTALWGQSNAFVQYGHDTLKPGPQQSQEQEHEHER
jgi:hypothetical protein